jgi:mRNA-degrading endonuclease toxin of MazEF toxin-antitoxin module
MEVQRGGIYLYEPPTAPGADAPSLLVASGSEQKGMRPYVIVSRDIVNRGKTTAVGVPLSSKIKKANSYRILLPVGELIREVSATWEFQDSVALTDHVRVIDTDRIRKRIGTLSDNALVAVVELGLGFIFDIR